MKGHKANCNVLRLHHMEEKNLTLKGSQLLKDVFHFFSIFHTKQNNFIVVYFFWSTITCSIPNLKNFSLYWTKRRKEKSFDFCPKFTLAQEPIHSLNENVCCTFEHQVIFLFDILYNPYEFVRGSLLDPADPCLIKCLASITLDVGITPGKTSLECNLVRCLHSLFCFRYYRCIPSRAQSFWLS